MTPETTEDANKILSKYYWMQRQSTYRNAARTTVRFLESLLRYFIAILNMQIHVNFLICFIVLI